jgi:hypothetical protein
MTDDTMALRTLLEKSPDADFLREMLWSRSRSDHSIRWIK